VSAFFIDVSVFIADVSTGFTAAVSVVALVSELLPQAANNPMANTKSNFFMILIFGYEFKYLYRFFKKVTHPDAGIR